MTTEEFYAFIALPENDDKAFELIDGAVQRLDYSSPLPGLTIPIHDLFAF
jgi:hypothetical protein